MVLWRISRFIDLKGIGGLRHRAVKVIGVILKVLRRRRWMTQEST